MSLCALSCWLLPALLLLLVSFPCCLHWADLWSCWVPLPATLPFLRGFHFSCWDLSPKSLICSDLTTSLLCSYFSLRCTLVAVSQLSFYLLLSFFTPIQLSQGHSCASQSWAWVQAADPGALVQPLEKTRVAQSSSSPRSVLGWHQPGRWQCRDLLFHLASLILTLSDVWSVSENSGFFRKKNKPQSCKRMP